MGLVYTLGMSRVQRILFVCMGNICRSPLAEGIFLSMLEKQGLADAFEVDSCGTGGWHAGELPDARARAVARKNGIELTSRARQIDPADFDRFDLIIVMDSDNHQNVLSLGCEPGRVRLMRSFDPALTDNDAHNGHVPDPYYGGDRGFDDVHDMLVRACEGLIAELTQAKEQA